MTTFFTDEILAKLDNGSTGSLELMREMLIESRKAGFDFTDDAEAIGHVKAEFQEIVDAFQSGKSQELEHEAGDLFLALSELLRRRDIPAELTIEHTIRKFCRRLAYVNTELQKRGKTLHDASWQGEAGKFWKQAKQAGL